MKDWILTIILCIIFVVCAKMSNLYFLDGTVVETTGNKVTVQSEDGNIWEFYGMGYGEQERVRMVMDDKDTCDNWDDEIKRVFSKE